MQRRLISILFLLLLFTSQAGHYLIFLYQQNQLQNEMEARLLAGIPESLLQIIEDDGSLLWEKEGKELYHLGELFDVVRTEERAGTTLLYCINDVKEKELLKNYIKALQSGHNNAAGKGKHTVKFQFTYYTAALLLPSVITGEDARRNYGSFEATLIDGSKDVSSPPPKA